MLAWPLTSRRCRAAQVLKLIDQYDLYGSVAYPKAHKQSDISDIYLLARETRGVFVNIALQEPFGLTLIEAAVHGAPIVATKHGGPVDIISTLKARSCPDLHLLSCCIICTLGARTPRALAHAVMCHASGAHRASR